VTVTTLDPATALVVIDLQKGTAAAPAMAGAVARSAELAVDAMADIDPRRTATASSGSSRGSARPARPPRSSSCWRRPAAEFVATFPC
jgi:hypothetical protein